MDEVDQYDTAEALREGAKALRRWATMQGGIHGRAEELYAYADILDQLAESAPTRVES